MNRITKVGGVIVGLGAAVLGALWLLKDRITGPAPAPAASPEAPRFRVSPPPPPPAEDSPAADDLSAVKGIGPVYKARLASEGVTTFAALAAADAEALAASIGVSSGQLEDWIAQAARLSG